MAEQANGVEITGGRIAGRLPLKVSEEKCLKLVYVKII